MHRFVSLCVLRFLGSKNAQICQFMCAAFFRSLIFCGREEGGGCLHYVCVYIYICMYVCMYSYRYMCLYEQGRCLHRLPKLESRLIIADICVYMMNICPKHGTYMYTRSLLTCAICVYIMNASVCLSVAGRKRGKCLHCPRRLSLHIYITLSLHTYITLVHLQSHPCDITISC
jgi:hypothetical protein